MGLSRTVSEIDGIFSRKSQNFPTLVFCVPAELELGTGAGVKKKLEWWATGPRKKFDGIFSRLDTIQTDRTQGKDRAYA